MHQSEHLPAAEEQLERLEVPTDVRLAVHAQAFMCEMPL